MLQQAVFIPVDSALLYHMPWEDNNPCEAEVGSQAARGGHQARQQDGKPSCNHQALGLFLISPPGRSCKSQHVTLGVTY